MLLRCTAYNISDKALTITSYKLIAEAQDYKGFDKHLMDNAKIIDATDSGVSICEFTITEQYGNLNGVMHGGAAGVIFDMCTTIALGPVAKPGSWEYNLLICSCSGRLT
jgi:acyl-coenzyme A thioesterase 13